MIKILTVIGARPQIIKAAALSRAIRNGFSDRIGEVILHTGQHYDDNMSRVFIDQMEVPQPDYNLNVGSKSHGRQTAEMIAGIEEVILKESPHCLVLYGDTNSTLAGAVAGSKLHVPVVHVEAGLRSFNKTMPEEINRITCDHASTLLFSPTLTGVRNLIREGFRENASPPYSIDNPKIYHCGDIMYDNTLFFKEIAPKLSFIIEELNLDQQPYVLGTIHRDNNTDQPYRLNEIFTGILTIAEREKMKVVLPLHPRTMKVLDKNLDPGLHESLKGNENIVITEPLPFFDITLLEEHAALILTDSGGVQKEAYFHKKPCIILRSETEWIEIVEQGTAILADANADNIANAYDHLLNNKNLSYPPIFGDGHAAEFICQELVQHF
jgi:UDP-GlcNAc3NAcA epimerase